jgi:hypothetical protein
VIATAIVSSLPILQAVAAFLDYCLVRKMVTGAGALWGMKEVMMSSAHEALGSTMRWKQHLMPVPSWAQERPTCSISAGWV